MSVEQRRELARFLKTRRARVQPSDVGLPSGGRRRTPGLRREEVALLANVGHTWYTWLEQGRDINVSVHVLDAIARALQMTEDEWSYLLSLAGHNRPSAPPHESVPGPVLQLLKAVEPFPAYVTGRYWDLLAWNEAECALYRDLDEVPHAHRNYVWLAFTDPRLRKLIVDWPAEAERVVAQFRATAGQNPGDERFAYLVNELLMTSPEFRACWARHNVARLFSRQRHFSHPTVGHIVLEHAMMRVADNPNLALVVQVPSDETSSQKLHELGRRSRDSTGVADGRTENAPQSFVSTRTDANRR